MYVSINGIKWTREKCNIAILSHKNEAPKWYGQLRLHGFREKQGEAMSFL